MFLFIADNVFVRSSGVLAYFSHLLGKIGSIGSFKLVKDFIDIFATVARYQGKFIKIVAFRNGVLRNY